MITEPRTRPRTRPVARVVVRREPTWPPPARPPEPVLRPTRPREVPGTARMAMPAGKVVVLMLVCFGVWTLLDAHTLRRSAEAGPIGARRSAALAILRPVDGLSRLLGIRRVAGLVETALGRNPNDTPGGSVAALPPLPPLPSVSGNDLPPRPHPKVTTPAPVRPRPSPQATLRPAPSPTPSEVLRPSPTPPPPPTPGVPPLRTPTSSDPLRVLVVGDSFGEDAGLGLSRAFDPTTVDLQQQALHSTGLSRPDYFDWPAQLRVDEARFHPDLVVIMIGANDPQALRLADGSVLAYESSGRWAALYGRRVDQMIREATAGGSRAVWIGLPPMHDHGFSLRVKALDRIYEHETAGRSGVVYVDSWSLFAGSNGTYQAFAHDAQGNVVEVRQGDGIHLTPSGNDLLASDVIRTLQLDWKLSPAAVRK